MADESQKQWYVLHTYSGYENKVKENIESRAQSMGMSDYIFRTIVPEQEETETKNGKTKTEMKKTFPGYVIVEMIMSDESWFVVRNTPGVTGFVGSHGAGSKPAPLLPDEIKHIFNGIDVTAQKSDLEVQEGDTIKITDGAFAGLEGKVVETDDEHQKLKAEIDMFGRATTAEVDYIAVEKQ